MWTCDKHKQNTQKSALNVSVLLPAPAPSTTHPAVVGIVGEPPHHRLQHVLLVPYVELLHGQQLAEAIVRELPELLGERHVAEVRLQELGGGVMDVVQAVVQGEEADADAVVGGDAALQELAAEQLQVGHEEQVGRLHHVLDGVLTERDLRRNGTKTKRDDVEKEELTHKSDELCYYSLMH